MKSNTAVVKPSYRVYEKGADRAFNILNNVILFIFLIIILYPIVYIISASVCDPMDVVSGKMWLWPTKLNFQGYIVLFKYPMVGVGYMNSLYYMITTVILNLVMTVMAAYPLSRKDFYGKNVFMFLFVFTMMFGGGLIPSYLLVKDLGMLHTRWAMIIPSAMSVWNVIITRTFFQSNIPTELLEASTLDGCDDFKFVWYIVTPLSKPVLAVVALFCAVGSWNSYFSALLYLNNRNEFPLQIVLRDILIMNSNVGSMSDMIDPERRMRSEEMRMLMKYSLIVIASLPVITIYPFVQKYFVKGVMIGALKG